MANLSLHHRDMFHMGPEDCSPAYAIAPLLACLAISAMIRIQTPIPASADACVSPSDTFPSAPGNVSCPVTGSGVRGTGMITNCIPLVNVGSDRVFRATPQDGNVDGPACPSNSALATLVLSSPRSAAFRARRPHAPSSTNSWISAGCASMTKGGFLARAASAAALLAS